MAATLRAKRGYRALAAALQAEIEKEKARREAALRLSWPKIRESFRGAADHYPRFVFEYERAGFRTKDFTEHDLGALSHIATLLARVQERLRGAGRRDDCIAALRRRIDHTLYVPRDRFTQDTTIVAAPSSHPARQ